MSPSPQLDLDGKTALVTGGGTGIGLAAACALASAGCRTVIAARRDEVLRQAAGSFDGAAPLLHHVVDVADRASVDTLFAWTAEQLGPIDILVNSSGINLKTRSMAAMAPQDWDRVLAVNASGAYNLMHAVLPQMRKNGGGLIVHINSIAGVHIAAIAGVAYTASKFALTGLVGAVAGEEAAHGIRITSICPGEVNTPLLDERPQPVGAEHRAQILQPEDVGAMILAVARLPARAHIPELIIKPLSQRLD
jgi:NAD(P)-dependent dehydrogenase (short-subunit alcohol dehydrogenase family)